ncbi:stage III sporulation protein AA [Tissierella pigra]|uniref:Stage III sporulation protein AA n=1 Tax=Tissierella pigra TaxID=2607614 RepID=A0A6N7XCY6_9FIRM|nr:stage III sporulation protein AA [Tissierella pigra]MBU5426671.1 stage III sporulation protein AA [Tissierella pigra]MST99888.1 stage III sporulation protein AA [Tissierella pigra]
MTVVVIVKKILKKNNKIKKALRLKKALELFFIFVIYSLYNHRIYIREGQVVLNNINLYDSVIENLCDELNKILIKIPHNHKLKTEEIRLRNGRPLSISYGGKDYFVNINGNLSSNPSNAVIVNERHIMDTFQLISNYSVYAYTEEIRNGYITIRGGHRVGIGGKVIYGLNGVENIRNISSLNIRIGREVLGVSNNILSYIIKNTNGFYNTLIISPPQCGKTTLLRDIVRNLSNGTEGNFKGFKVSLVDERSELAGMYNGMAQKDVGMRTDILDGCLKSDGIIMAIRALSPDIIAVDEIGGKKDAEAIHEALRAGIKLMATVHGSSLEEVRNKSSIRELFTENIFERFIILDRSDGVGTIKEIVDGYSYKPIFFRKSDLNGSS